MWDLPGPGLKPVSPALAGGFLTTAPPGTSNKYILFTAVSNTYYSDWHIITTKDDGDDYSYSYIVLTLCQVLVSILA